MVDCDIGGWIYLGNDFERYVLGEPKQENLLIFGVNPSKAVPNNLDPTMKNIKKIIEEHKDYKDCGYIMMNLFPQRTSNPEELKDNPALLENNIKILEVIVKTFNVKKIWCAWGDAIDIPNARKFLIESLKKIYKTLEKGNYEWICYGETTNGNPRHPCPRNPKLISFDWPFEKFEIEGYL
ncbi:MAG: DUF1643 domain-containing protein [Selenomonadaceae bacterium]|nr:DUF1643 domain-containing protein [Selenomonadaceae bacterium]